MKSDTAMINKMEWSISVPIFRNTDILKQLGIAIGIPFGLVALVVGLASGKSVYTLYGLGIFGALLFFTWLFIVAFYRGKYGVEFVLNDKGALCRAQEKQAKKNQIVNTLTVTLGLFTGRHTVAGAGLLAHSRQEVFLKWNCVTKVKYKPKSRTILLGGGFSQRIALFCMAENYPQIERVVMLRTTHIRKKTNEKTGS